MARHDYTADGAADEASAEKGRVLERRAARWIYTHPDGWAELKDAAAEVDARYGVVNRTLVGAWLVDEGLRVSDVPEYCRAHDLWSGIARYLADECPGLNVSTGASCIDAAYRDGLPGYGEERWVR